MKKICAIIFLLLYMIGVFSFTVCAQTQASDESVISGSNSMDAQMPVLGSDPKITNAKSVLLYEVNTDTLMYAWNADERLEPASFVKILTALIAIEKGNLSDKVTVTEAVLNTVAYDAYKTKLKVGEVMSLEDLLYCMMVDSGNDAAAVIAEHVCGSQTAFVEQLNLYAANFGCTSTNFTNVHGLNDENQYTTARDVGRILAAASKNETFCEIFGTIYHSIPANSTNPEDRNLASKNYLLNDDSNKNYYDARVLGSRTGVDSEGYRCVASIAEQNGLRFVAIVMGSASVYNGESNKTETYGGYIETSELLDLASSGFKSYQIIYQGQVLKQMDVIDGDCAVSLGASNAASTVLPSGVKISDLTVKIEHLQPELKAPIEKGQIVSTAKYMYNSICVAQTDLYALNDVRTLDNSVIIEENTSSASSGWGTVWTVLLIIVIAVLLTYGAIKVLKITARNKSQRNARRRKTEH